MGDGDAVIATYSNHAAADAAVKQLTTNGFEFKNLSVIGKGFHSEETAVGFYTVGDRVKFWGERGAFWGGLWGLFFGGVLMTVPLVGQVVVLGYLASMVVSAIEGALVIGGLSAFGAAIVSLGLPKDSVVKYETALRSDGFILMVHGDANEVARAHLILNDETPIALELHSKVRYPLEQAAIAL